MMTFKFSSLNKVLQSSLVAALLASICLANLTFASNGVRRKPQHARIPLSQQDLNLLAPYFGDDILSNPELHDVDFETIASVLDSSLFKENENMPSIVETLFKEKIYDCVNVVEALLVGPELTMQYIDYAKGTIAKKEVWNLVEDKKIKFILANNLVNRSSLVYILEGEDVLDWFKDSVMDIIESESDYIKEMNFHNRSHWDDEDILRNHYHEYDEDILRNARARCDDIIHSHEDDEGNLIIYDRKYLTLLFEKILFENDINKSDVDIITNIICENFISYYYTPPKSPWDIFELKVAILFERINLDNDDRFSSESVIFQSVDDLMIGYIGLKLSRIHFKMKVSEIMEFNGRLSNNFSDFFEDSPIQIKTLTSPSFLIEKIRTYLSYVFEIFMEQLDSLKERLETLNQVENDSSIIERLKVLNHQIEYLRETGVDAFVHSEKMIPVIEQIVGFVFQQEIVKEVSHDLRILPILDHFKNEVSLQLAQASIDQDPLILNAFFEEVKQIILSFSTIELHGVINMMEFYNHLLDYIVFHYNIETSPEQRNNFRLNMFKIHDRFLGFSDKSNHPIYLESLSRFASKQ